eukprot:6732389-Prorocentrum_lima.AAC.1
MGKVEKGNGKAKSPEGKKERPKDRELVQGKTRKPCAVSAPGEYDVDWDTYQELMGKARRRRILWREC